MQEYIEFFQQNMILSLAWVGILVALILNIFKSSTAKYQTISVNELTHLINKEDGVVVDLRSNDEFRQGHITESVNLLPSEIKSGSYGSLENRKSTPIIVVCKTGQIAQESATLLAKAGFEKVSLLKNGLVAWNEANLPLVRGKK
ncbi:rhodanese-like domain-containing protein [Vibrio gazogenes]|uniref:Rhodanese-related sulfurtransferase n=1 Tax=Vibrio gazogenes DSM 21264 = NBRC 103151 TaxID=1123492 RepID=A0A1M5BGV6_VIBGA|nr:rhodanese-like domain-containing protein [Vibrio gazogenes]USP13992.1 rhodanese-like domain-containing protein [Vibrio gazogenes]SHF41600.1 Rhodanese-related sulfurtransferase [Vibrio gazogenes DSM 21264] [Vibrio gazogenes DSM 21264 = NBRC 103151]SJN57751.1 Thiosulfate sulfurtransferase GlpE [Vibrio gazogenes]